MSQFVPVCFSLSQFGSVRLSPDQSVLSQFCPASVWIHLSCRILLQAAQASLSLFKLCLRLFQSVEPGSFYFIRFCFYAVCSSLC